MRLRSAWSWPAIAAIVVVAAACTNDYGAFQFVDDSGSGRAAGSGTTVEPGGTAGGATIAGSDETCNGGSACNSEQTCCPLVGCKDLAISRTNCGACGQECPKGFTCQGGSCICGRDGACKSDPSSDD